jgi:hypothetical protein
MMKPSVCLPGADPRPSTLRGASARLTTAVLVLSVVLHGCSFIGSRAPDPPPPGSSGAYLTCSFAEPSIDMGAGTVIASIGLMAHYRARRDERNQHPELTSVFFTLPSLVLGSILAASGIFGFSRSVKCHAVKEEAERAVAAANGLARREGAAESEPDHAAALPSREIVPIGYALVGPAFSSNGGDANAALALAGAIRIPRIPVWARVHGQYGTSYLSGDEEVSFLRAGGALELRICGDNACAFGAVDLSYQRQSEPSLTIDGPIVGPRLGFEWGRSVQLHVALEATGYFRDGRTESAWALGVGLTTGILFRFSRPSTPRPAGLRPIETSATP